MHTFKELFFFWVVVKLTDLDLKALKQCAMRCTVVDNVVNRGIFRTLNFEQFTFEFYFRKAKVDEKDEF